MSYYPEADNQIRNKKSIFRLGKLCYQGKIKTCYSCWYIWFSCWKGFVSLKAKFGKLDINDLVKIPS